MKRIINAAFADTSSSATMKVLYDKLLYYISDRFRVSGPKSRGARQPEFNPAAVNESNFGDNLRYKSYYCEVIGDRLFIKWVTQEPFIDAEAPALVEEIKRCIDHLYYEFSDDNGGLVPYPTVDVDISSRDGYNYGHYVTSFN